VTRISLLILMLAAAAMLAVPADAAPKSAFITPTWGRLTSPLGWRADPFRPAIRQHHWGIDIAAVPGTPVVASASGTVQYAGAYAGYGSSIYIYHGHGWATVYAHLSAIHVERGTRVSQGTRIGAVGSEGRSTGPHLHFEIRYMNHPVDPLKYLGNPRARP
jgi:murein DD-endopeptidase MepM/ murein hydrolase activator NlpD